MPGRNLMWENPNLVHLDAIKGGYRFFESSMRLECFILPEALLQLAHRASAREDEFFWLFRTHRHRIWETAQKKVDCEDFELDGSLIIRPGDL
jgi:hypothetical protein